MTRRASDRRANQLLIHPKPVFGSLTICHRNSIYKKNTNTKELTPEQVHEFIVTLNKYISSFFLLKIEKNRAK